MRVLISAVLLLLAVGSAHAQDVGFFVRTDCDTLSPVNFQTMCLQTTTTGGRTAGKFYGYSSGWVEVGSDSDTDDQAASEVAFTPAGNLAATDVQAAIEELDDEKQPLDSDLTAVAGLSSTGLVARTGSGTASARTITGNSQVTVSNGDGVSGNPTLSITADSIGATQIDETDDYTLSGTVDFTGTADVSGASFIIGAFTVANLPAAGTANRIAVVTDGNAAGDCTTGSGSTVSLCRDTGSVWAALGDGNTSATPTFADIGAGTSTAALVVGNSGTLAPSGTGTIEANKAGAAGIEFTESDSNPTCSAGNFTIYADLSEAKLKKCTNGSASDLAPASTGDVAGPAASTDNAVARYDSTTGKILLNSGVVIDDNNDVTGANSITTTGASSGKMTFSGVTSGTAAIGVADVAGTPAQINLPTATATAGNYLKSDGATPQVTSWAFPMHDVIRFGTSDANANDTDYLNHGGSFGSDNISSTNMGGRAMMGFSGTVVEFGCEVLTAPSGANTVTFTLATATTPTGALSDSSMTFQLTGASVSDSTTSNQLAVTKGDFLGIKKVDSASATPSSSTLCYVRIQG